MYMWGMIHKQSTKGGMSNQLHTALSANASTEWRQLPCNQNVSRTTVRAASLSFNKVEAPTTKCIKL